MTQHVMVDLETLGTDVDSVILSIGATKFDPNDKAGEIEKFYTVIDIEAKPHVGNIDRGTLVWWFNPERDGARDEFVREDRVDLASALDGFSMWFGPEPMPVWGNGASFDNAIMAWTHDQLNMPLPWGYRDDRCFRTLRSLGPDVSIEDAGVSHNALDDALYQTHLMRAIVAELGLTL